MDVLDNILSERKESLEISKKEKSFASLESLLKQVQPRPSFLEAISKPNQISLIAEMKRKSPSAGALRNPYQPDDIALEYEKAGASALSILTERHNFGGDISDLAQVKLRCQLPLLRKDFLFDPYQVLEAKVFGASAILLIADMLDESLLCELASYARDLKLDTLVEIFTAESVEPALRTQSPIVGINSRNLRTLQMFPDNIKRLGEMIPQDKILVAESGIKTADDVKALMPYRVSAILVGESLLKQKDLHSAAKILVEAGKNI